MVTGQRSVVAAASLAVFVAGSCKPDLNDTASIVSTAQVLGVRSDPAEAPPKGTVTLTALVADATGALPGAPVAWAFCNARKPLAELGPVNPLCLEASGDWFSPAGVGTRIAGTIPSIACKQFGPEVPVPQLNQPAGRPVDPDPTGGYYQPVRLLVPGSSGDVVAIGQPRLSCGLAGATPQQAAELSARYRVNQNPQVQALAVVGGDPLASPGSPRILVTDEQGATSAVAAGQTLTLEVSWPTCPTSDVCGDGVCGPDETAAVCAADCAKPAGCGGAERYVNLDLGTRALVDQREGIHVAWYATGGAFALDRTGRDGSDATPTSDNSWTAPAKAGPVHVWVVLHDDRGGAGWAGYALDVR